MTLPHNQYVPAHALKSVSIAPVAETISFQLGLPVFFPRFWHGGQSASLVPMPKTSMNKNNFTSPGQRHVRLSGQVSAMKPIPISHGVHHAAHGKLRFRVLAPDAGHLPASFFRRDGVSQYQYPLSGIRRIRRESVGDRPQR